MHSATIKTLELNHFQIKILKGGGQAKAKEGRMLPLPPLKETLIMILLLTIKFLLKGQFTCIVYAS